MSQPTDAARTGEKYRVGTDAGRPGDQVTHSLFRVRPDGVLVTLYAAWHDPGLPCDLCILDDIKKKPGCSMCGADCARCSVAM